MPELPEVETIRRQLARTIKGAIIKNVLIRNTKILKTSKAKFLRAVLNKKIKAVDRRAKLLILELSSPSSSSGPRLREDKLRRGSLFLLFHLKMTGRMLLVGKNDVPTKHTHIVFKLSGAKHPIVLFFEDYRKFGFVKLFNDKELKEYFETQAYGPEPLSKNFTYKIMKACLSAKPNKKIKQLLMEQSCIAGIGNIYASEICFYARVHPERQIKNLKENEFKKIYTGTKKILRSAISSGGSSSDTYLDAHGKQGKFVSRLKVYGREGTNCVQCKSKIKKQKIGGRGTFFCSKCQK